MLSVFDKIFHWTIQAFDRFLISSVVPEILEGATLEYYGVWYQTSRQDEGGSDPVDARVKPLSLNSEEIVAQRL